MLIDGFQVPLQTREAAVGVGGGKEKQVHAEWRPEERLLRDD